MLLTDPEVESSLLISADEGASYRRHSLGFDILSLLFHPEQEDWILAYSHDQKVMCVRTKPGAVKLKLKVKVEKSRRDMKGKVKCSKASGRNLTFFGGCFCCLFVMDLEIFIIY